MIRATLASDVLGLAAMTAATTEAGAVKGPLGWSVLLPVRRALSMPDAG